MPVHRPIQTNFLGGEYDPLMNARADDPRFKDSARTIENFLVTPQGTVARRPGLRFVYHIPDDIQMRLIPFTFSDQSAYIVGMSTAGFSIFKDGAIITQASTSGIYGTAGQPYVPTSGDEIFSVGYAESADVMYFGHKSYKPFTLSRIADDSWTPAYYTAKYGPFLPENVDVNAQIGFSGGFALAGGSTTGGWANGNIIIGYTGSGTVYTTGTWGTTQGPFVAGNTSGVWKVRQNLGGTVGQLFGYFQITGGVSVSGNSAGATVVLYQDLDNPSEVLNRYKQAAQVTFRGLGSTVGTFMWSMPAWGGMNTAGVATGYPSVVGFHEDRLYWMGSSLQPSTVWGSESNQFTSMFEGDASDDNSVEFTPSANKVNAALSFTTYKDMTIFTDGGEMVCSGGDNPITPTNVAFRMQTAWGSKPGIPAIQIDNRSVFVERGGRRLRELVYTVLYMNYEAFDLTLKAHHISESGFTGMDWQPEPYRTLWLTRADGQIATCCYDRTDEIVAWARQVTDGIVESLAVIPDATKEEWQVWVVVKRFIGGSWVRYVEVFDWSMHTDAGITGALATTYPIVRATAVNILGGKVRRQFWISGDYTSVFTAGFGMTCVNCSQDAINGSFVVTGSSYNLSSNQTFIFSNTTVGYPISGVYAAYDGLLYDSSSSITPQSVWHGLGHLLGKTVDVLGDGGAMGAYTVGAYGTAGTDGAVTLGWNVSTVEIGLPYAATLIPQPPELPVQSGGSGMGRTKKPGEMSIRVQNCNRLMVNGQSVIERRDGDPPNAPIPHRTGIIQIDSLSSQDDPDSPITLVIDGPNDGIILGFAFSVDVPKD